MEIKAMSGEIARVTAGAVLVSIFEGEKSPEGDAAIIDKAMGGTIKELIKLGDIKGKEHELTLLHTLGKLPADHAVIMGLGKKDELTVTKLRHAMGDAVRFIRGKNGSSIAVPVPGAGANGIKAEEAVQAMTEGAILGLYTFKEYITKKDSENGDIKTITIIGSDKAMMEKAIANGKIMADATNWARDMVNEPSNHMTPTDMAEEAMKMAKENGLKVEVFDKENMKELGMGGLLGVAQGSNQPPKFIVLTYNGRSSKDIDWALVGKGITFDSGGISIKPSENMGDMKGDMAGGASVMAAIKALAQLKAKANVVAIIPATENMPSGTAQKPGDIIRISNGKTVEVVNTDAEGRLILADGLSYTVKLGAKQIIDVATLTGSCQVALGNITTGAFTNSQPLLDKVIEAGKEAGEPTWQMPMFDDYKELIKSDVADMKNSGSRYGGAISAAKFLEEFVDKKPWVHLDIAGTYDTDKDKGCQCKGGTGTPVRTLVNLVMKSTKK